MVRNEFQNETNTRDVEDAKPQDSYKRLDYIPSRYTSSSCFKIGVIVGSIIAVLFLIGVTIGVYWQNDSQSTDTHSTDDSMVLVAGGSHGYGIFDVTNRTLDKSHLYPFYAEYRGMEFYGLNNIFCSNATSHSIFHVFASDILGNYTKDNFSEGLKDERLNLENMAYDAYGKNLYVVDKSMGALLVVDAVTYRYNILLTDLVRPHHIELDSSLGLMFILQQSDSILIASMDGSKLVKIVESTSVTAMTIDTKNQRIYYADHSRGIISTNYDGKDSKTFPIDALNIIDMAIANDELYWIWESDDSLTTHHLQSCEIKDDICDNHKVHDQDYLGDFATIKATVKHPRKISPEKNPCAEHDCQQFCLIASNGKASCACETGWQLDHDRKTCRRTKDFMLYALDNHFRGRILDSGRAYSIDAILPTPYKLADGKELTGFDYDLINDNLYFSDDKNIYTMKLKSNWTGQDAILRGDNVTSIKDIAYDWMTGNLYYMENKLGGGFKLRMFNIQLNSTYIKTLNDSNSFSLSENNEETDPRYPTSYKGQIEPNTLAIYPKLGYIAYSLTTGYATRKGIVRIAKTNGTEVREMTDVAYPYPGLKSLSIDQSDGRVYWLVQGDKAKVKSTNFDGTDTREIKLDGLRSVTGISVLRKYMYIDTYHGVYRVENAKIGAKTKILPGGSGDRSDRRVGIIKVFSESVVKSQDIMDHPCNQKENGGCDQFCFLNDGRSQCSCRDTEIIGPLGHCLPVNNTKS